MLNPPHVPSRSFWGSHLTSFVFFARFGGGVPVYRHRTLQKKKKKLSLRMYTYNFKNKTCLGLVHGDDPERCYEEGDGRGVHVWECMYTHGGFMSMYGKTNTVL